MTTGKLKRIDAPQQNIVAKIVITIDENGNVTVDTGGAAIALVLGAAEILLEAGLQTFRSQFTKKPEE